MIFGSLVSNAAMPKSCHCAIIMSLAFHQAGRRDRIGCERSRCAGRHLRNLSMSEQNNQIEFEIKAQVNDRTTLKTLLDAATYCGHQLSADTYYDVASSDLFKFGVFVRVRDHRNLQIKFNPDTNDFTHTTAYEQNYDLPLTAEKSQTVRDFLDTFLPIKQTEGSDILSQFGLEEFVEVKKKRETFNAEGVTICLDDVDGLGLFVEIEAIDPQKTSF